MVLSSDLSWIVVSDLKKAKEFFTNIVGLKVLNVSEEFGWAELGGESGGAVIGLAEESPMMEGITAGNNAVITLTVEDADKATEALKKKGVELVGDMMEVPGHVKLQMFKDPDGNLLQIVEKLDK
jgi:predicted enzyme related to lactoylglutathione lyase